jgi:hypothetical protein
MSNEQITWIFCFSFAACIAAKAVQLYFLNDFLSIGNEDIKPNIKIECDDIVALQNNIQQTLAI